MLVSVKLDVICFKGLPFKIADLLYVFVILNSTDKTKLAILTFLYCWQIVKNSIELMTIKCQA